MALNPKCTPDILNKLASDKYWEVRVACALNENCPIELLIKLSNDQNKYVVESAKNNPNFPDDISGWSIGLDEW